MRQNRKQKAETRARMSATGVNFTTARRQVLEGGKGSSGLCPDCGVAPGENHRSGCDIERCATCGLQVGACDHPPTTAIPWTGMWPGEAECREFGWFARLLAGQGWVPCAPADPGASPDLNRLYTEASWDRAQKRWVRG